MRLMIDENLIIAYAYESVMFIGFIRSKYLKAKYAFCFPTASCGNTLLNSKCFKIIQAIFNTIMDQNGIRR